MDNAQAIAGSIARLREADNEARASGVAFATGKFNEYLAAKTEAIRKRMDAEYDDLTADAEGGSEQAPSGSGPFAEDSGAGGGVAGSSTDARQPREES